MIPKKIVSWANKQPIIVTQKPEKKDYRNCCCKETNKGKGCRRRWWNGKKKIFLIALKAKTFICVPCNALLVEILWIHVLYLYFNKVQPQNWSTFWSKENSNYELQRLSITCALQRCFFFSFENWVFMDINHTFPWQHVLFCSRVKFGTSTYSAI